MDFLIFLGVAVFCYLVYGFILWLCPKWGRSPEELKQYEEEIRLYEVREMQKARRSEAYWKGKTPPPGWS